MNLIPAFTSNFIKLALFYAFLFGKSVFVFAQEGDSFFLKTVQEADSFRYLRTQVGYEAALAKMEVALLRAKTANIPDTLLALLHHKNAVLLYTLLRPADALESVEKAIELRTNEAAALEKSLYLRAVIQRDRGNYLEARRDLEEGIDLLENQLNNQDLLKLAQRRQWLSILNKDIGDFQNALINARLSLNHFQELYGVEHKSTAVIYNILGAVWHDLQQYDRAIEQYEKALNILKSSERSNNLPELAQLYNNRALSYEALENETAAIEDYQNALNLDQRLLTTTADPLFLLEQVQIYSNLIELYIHQAQYAKADQTYVTAQQLLKGLPNGESNAVAVELKRRKGDLEQQKGNSALALSVYEEILNDLLPDSIQKMPLRHPKEMVLTLMAKAAILSENDKKQALATYERADLLLTTIRRNYAYDESKFALLNNSISMYENATKIAFELYQNNNEKKYLEKTYQLGAKSKSSVLLDHIQANHALKFGGVPPEILQQERNFKAQLAALENTYYNQQNNLVRSDSLRNLWFEKQEAYQGFIRQLENKYPEYFKLKYPFNNPISITDVQNQLEKNEAVVEYFMGEEVLFIWTITAENVWVTQRQLPPDFDKTVSKFVRSISDWTWVQDSAVVAEQAYLQTAEELSELLVKNLQELPAQINQLTIVPDASLNYISFEVLLSKPINSWMDNEGFLLQKYAIGYTYSTQLLLATEAEQRAVAPEWFASFGLEYDDFTLKQLRARNGKDSIQNQFLLEGLRGDQLSPLEYSDDEAAGIAEFLEGISWLNTKVTKANFLEQAPLFRVLHLAMHSFADEKFPLNSSLIFTKTTDSTDNMLRLNEIFNLQLSAEMVVLSACNTAYGVLNKGEGTMGFARAFTYAGSPSLIATNWSIPDHGTFVLMKHFYTHLLEGKNKSLALKNAKLDYLKQASPELSKPIYWAAPILIGSPLPILPNDSFNYTGWLIAGILFMLLIIFLLKR